MCALLGRIGRIVFALAGVAFWQQLLLAHLGGAGFGTTCACCAYTLAWAVSTWIFKSLGSRRQHLVGLNVITDIDLALDDFAADPKDSWVSTRA